ncbi:MAG: hypothetical protein A2Z17_05705 [Gammaproteobacteria bacterium RBG_16_66_13]|nr:MAG: hypothetical protein A2Z17_05705 [Gammaproteobacteria bacterium RBG_16_66_13]
MRRSFAFSTSAVLLVIFLAACASATPAPIQGPLNQPPPADLEQAPLAQPPAADLDSASGPPDIGGAAGALSEPQEEAPPSGAILYRTGAEPASPATSPRLIIKDAQILLLVEDADPAIDGIMQVVGDVGGYVISSRVWYQTWYDGNYKYASLTIGVPAIEFERAIRRLRSLAIRVIDETSTGQDVTDEYVDLQSRLQSLQATRSRILEFLDRATSVAEALQVNQELAGVEAQIEEVQGRINYLSGRSSFSTITISLEPDLPIVTLTPTPTPTITPTPTATPTPIPWDPSKTFNGAKSTVTLIYQSLAELAIWLAVVFVPVVGPVLLIAWLIWMFTKRRLKTPPEQ